jgi:hypothetical protein
MLLTLALAGCVHLDFLDSDQIEPDQAGVQPAQANDRVIALSVISIQSKADAGLNRGGRIMVRPQQVGLYSSSNALQATAESERIFLQTS